MLNTLMTLVKAAAEATEAVPVQVFSDSKEPMVRQIWTMVVESKALNIVGTLVLLLIGWLIALTVSQKLSSFANKLTEKAKQTPEGAPAAAHVETVASKVSFYLIMIITLLACFSVLDLDAAAAPLQSFISKITDFAPNIIGALLLIISAWIIAGIARTVTKTAVLKSSLSRKLAAQVGAGSPEDVANYTAKTIYYVIFLFFLPAILNALQIYGITAPLQSMFEKVLTYIPNLIAAVIILVVGLCVAGIVRKAVTGVVVISRLDALGEKVGVSKLFGNAGLAPMFGIIAYILVAIPVLISSLTALQISALTNSVAGFFNQLLSATGNIIGAVVILFVALLAGGFVSSLVMQFLANIGFDEFLKRLGVKSNKNSLAPSVVIGKLTFVAIIVLAILAACDILGFVQLAELIRRFAVFGANVLLSIVVLLIGIWLANFAADAVKGKCNELVIVGIRAGVISFTVALAVSNLDIGDTIVSIAFTLILGAICVASAIAFGVGGREVAANILKEWHEKLKK